jgi:hypothetical protein
MKYILYDNRTEEGKKALYKKLKDLPEGEYVIEVKQNRPNRSINANKYYHAVLNIICTETGQGTGDKNFDHEQLHEILKRKFNSETIIFPKGGTEIVGKSTSDLDSKEFTIYVNRVKQWAKDEFGIDIPEPEDVTYKRWMEFENNYNKTFSGF